MKKDRNGNNVKQLSKILAIYKMSKLLIIQFSKDKNDKFIIWLVNRIKINNNRINTLESMKCKTSESYFDYMQI